MKKILLLVLVLSFPFVSTKAQSVNTEKIIENDIPRNTLYANAQTWGTSNDPTCKKYIASTNSETGNVIVDVNLTNTNRAGTLTNYLTYKFSFSVKIDCKDGKYRYIISDPSVLVGVENIEYKYLPVATLTQVQSEFEAVEWISATEFEKILDWQLAKVISTKQKYEQQIESFNQQLKELEGNKKEKKEVKYIKYKLVQLSNQVSVLNEIIQRWQVAMDNVAKDLECEMNNNDTF